MLRDRIATRSALWTLWTLWTLGLLGTIACAPPTEAPRVVLPVVVDGSRVAPVVTNLGYEVTLSKARLALGGLGFTATGELSATQDLWHRASELLVPTAYAHPGHAQGGEIIGEMVGRFVIDWASEDGRQLGEASMFVGRYGAAEFIFGTGASPPLDSSDPLVSHTARLSGVATRAGESIAFRFTIDSPEGRELIGAPFDADITTGAAGALHFTLSPLDEVEGDTMFDDVDFLTLDADGDGSLEVEPDAASVAPAYNAVRRALLTHDHYSVALVEVP